MINSAKEYNYYEGKRPRAVFD